MKIWNYTVILIFLALIFEFAGFHVSGTILTFVGISVSDGTAGFQSSDFWTAMTDLLLGAVGLGLAFGVLTRAPSENYVVLPFLIYNVLLFFAILTGILSVAQTMPSWIFYISLAIIAPLAVGFVISAVEFFRGGDQ